MASLVLPAPANVTKPSVSILYELIPVVPNLHPCPVDYKFRAALLILKHRVHVTGTFIAEEVLKAWFLFLPAEMDSPDRGNRNGNTCIFQFDKYFAIITEILFFGFYPHSVGPFHR
jgi:hypothetical protein